MANFKPNSRYTNGVVSKNRNNKNFLVLRRPLNIQPGEDDIFITVNQEHQKRPDLLASQLYGQPELWWAIYEFNNIIDPLFDLKIGQILRIPSLNRVLEAIDNIES